MGVINMMRQGAHSMKEGPGRRSRLSMGNYPSTLTALLRCIKMVDQYLQIMNMHSGSLLHLSQTQTLG